MTFSFVYFQVIIFNEKKWSIANETSPLKRNKQSEIRGEINIKRKHEQQYFDGCQEQK